MIEDPETLTGMVLNGAHGIYDVHTDNGILRCTLRGKLKKAFAEAQSAKSVGKMRPRYDKMLYSARSQRAAPIRPTNEAAPLPLHGQVAREENEAAPLEQSQPANDAALRQAGKHTVRGQVGRSEKEREANAALLPVRLTIGDFVKLRQIDAKTGLIEEILPRQSALSRKDASSTDVVSIQQTMLANLDQVVLVFATTQPEPHFGMLDRYLAICESAEIRPIVCLNKVDLPHDKRVEEAADLYSQLGYTVIWTSPKTGVGIDTLHSLLREHTTLFTGPSGVGKSSLVNAIEPGMAIKTGLISDATGKGKHTTTGSQLYPLTEGGWLADSAGIRALATWNIAPQDLAWCFVEFRPYLGECIYSDCMHIDEEGCAIRQAVDDNFINARRYMSYVRMVTGEER